MNRHRPWFWLALFLALHGAFLRAFIPVGFMPSFSNAGVRLAFCTPSGAQSTLSGALDEAAVHAGDECVYALALSAALASSLPVVALVPVASQPVTAFAVAIDAFTWRAYSARGPPVLVS